MGPPSPPYDPQMDANRYSILLWTHIMEKIKYALAKHHESHEPGGKDTVYIPLGGLRGVLVNNPAVGQVLAYTSFGTGGIWRNMEATALGGTIAYGSATSGAGQAFFEATGSITPGVIPGPTNLFGTAVMITRVRFAANGPISGSESLTGQTFAFAGTGVDDNTGLAVTWADGASLGMTITAAEGTALYLTADVHFQRGTA